MKSSYVYRRLGGIVALTTLAASMWAVSATQASAYTSDHSYSYVAPDLELDIRLLKDINPGLGDATDASSGISGLTVMNGRMFFRSGDGVHGEELWVSDGTDTGTTMLKDLWPGPTAGYPYDFANIGSYVIFNAEDGVHGREPWVSDGTEAGTRLLKDINTSDQAPENAWGYTELASGKAVFSAWTQDEGAELWITDGTEAGTQLLKAIQPGPASGYPSGFYAYNGKVLFGADDGGGETLWITDGTPDGTVKIGGPNTNAINYAFGYFLAYGSSLFFTGQDPDHGWEWWVTDTTAAGTRLLKDINPGPDTGFCGLTGATIASGKFVMPADDGQHGCELWQTDGTTAGTALLADVVPGADPSYPYAIGRFGSGASFLPNTPDAGWEYWVTDGTAAGTHIVTDLNPGPAAGVWGGTNYESSNYAQRLFFTGSDVPSMNPYWWISDGTASGTRQMVNAYGNGMMAKAGNLVFLMLRDSDPQAWADGVATGSEWWVVREIPRIVTPPSIDTTRAALSTTLRAKPTPPSSGRTYTANAGSWAALSSPTISYTYQWYSCQSPVSTGTTTLPSGCTAVTGATGTSISLPDGDPTTNLAFAVTATIPGAGSKTFWTPTVAVAAAATTPSAVVNLTVDTSKSKQASIKWQPGYDGGSPVTRYEFRYFSAGSVAGAWKSNKLATSATITGLRPGTSYSVEVRAVNAVGAGNPTTATFTAR